MTVWLRHHCRRDQPKRITRPALRQRLHSMFPLPARVYSQILHKVSMPGPCRVIHFESEISFSIMENESGLLLKTATALAAAGADARAGGSR